MIKLVKTLSLWAESVLFLFYPKLCLACNFKEPSGKGWYCLDCRIKIPKTDYHLHQENEFTRRFWGRVKLESGAAFYLFRKGGLAQNVVHNLKYKRQHQIGVILGKEYGEVLKESPHFQNIDLIIPVPMHWKKLRLRGYNQSEVFAQGLSQSMGIPYLPDGLKKVEHSKSQTKKSKMDRLISVETVFEVNKINELKGKHILLVDDVLTSGATLEACGNALLKVPNTKVSMATIAIRPRDS